MQYATPTVTQVNNLRRVKQVSPTIIAINKWRVVRATRKATTAAIAR